MHDLNPETRASLLLKLRDSADAVDQLVVSSNFKNVLIGDLWVPLSSNATQEGVTVTDQINNVTYKVIKP